MEKPPERPIPHTETTGEIPPNQADQTIETAPRSEPPNPTSAERERIRLVKERLLERGAVVIEPLEHDPFVLSRDYVPTGEGVTIFKPDGTIETISMEEYDAELAKGRRAAQFFEGTAEERRAAEEKKPKLRRLLHGMFSWLGRGIGKVWTKLWDKVAEA